MNGLDTYRAPPLLLLLLLITAAVTATTGLVTVTVTFSKGNIGGRVPASGVPA